MTSPLSVIQEAALRRMERLALAPGCRILDAPCGRGDLTKALLESGHRAVGVDLGSSARERLGAAFLEADLGQTLPFRDGELDVAVSTEGIEHLENPFFFLRELRRVVHPGGLLLLTTPNTVGLRSRVRFLGSGFFHHDPRPLRESGRDPMHHISLKTFAELRYGLATSGFRIRTVGCTHVKPVSLGYAIFVPWIAVYTFIAFRKEKDPAQRVANRQIRRTLLSPPLLLGENLLIVAERE